MENLPRKTQEQLQQINVMREKAAQAGDTLNPAKAKRLATEVLTGAVDLVEQLVIAVGKSQVKHVEVELCCK